MTGNKGTDYNACCGVPCLEGCVPHAAPGQVVCKFVKVTTFVNCIKQTMLDSHSCIKQTMSNSHSAHQSVRVQNTASGDN